MKRLTALSNPRMAQAFIDYMASRGIQLQMMPEGEGMFALWLVEEQHEVEALAELEQFVANPHDSKYSAASWDVGNTKNNPFRYSSPSFVSMIKAKAGPFTLAIMVLTLVVFTLQSIGVGRAVFQWLHFPAEAAQQWQIWRWLSHAVLHFSITHIVFNLLWWWDLGGSIERRLGFGKLAQIFVVSAALSGAGQFYVEGANFGGLSGVVYALLGYMWILGTKAPHLNLALPKPIIGFMLVWLVLGFVQPFWAIANTAHLVGLLSGIALALIDSGKVKYRAVS